MREPAFWRRRGLLALLLSPLGAIYGAITATRMRRGLQGLAPGVPVICVGNYSLGGTGKTQAVLTLVAALREMGETPVVLSRGYGGRLAGPVQVDPSRHGSADVGDEPLMLAAGVTVVVARDRVGGAALARARGASVIVMDDGLQNPALRKDLSLVVIDAAAGLGNGFSFPAGPLRAPLREQLPFTDALLVVGDGTAADAVAQAVAGQGKPLLRAAIVPHAESVAALRGQRLLAFAGIGDPARFFGTLRSAGLDVAATRSFADHHAYTEAELATLRADAKQGGLTLVTTAKDAARIARADDIATFNVSLHVANNRALRDLVAAALGKARQPRR